MMLGARTAALAKSGAPLPYLRKLAFLESDGHQYIDTGININNYNFGVVKCMLMPLVSGGTYAEGFFGCGPYGTNSFKLCRHNGVYTFWDFDKFVQSPVRVVANSIAEVEIGMNAFKVNETSTPAKRISGSPGSSLTLFAFNNNGKIYGSTPCRIYDWSGGGISLIPVMSKENRPCFYDDTESEVPSDDPSRFFYNQGTGEFTWG